MSTFTDAQQLASLQQDTQALLMHNFVMATPSERHGMVMTMCPPHVRKIWLLGVTRESGSKPRSSLFLRSRMLCRITLGLCSLRKGTPGGSVTLLT